MNSSAIDQVADAVLYEGYILYPYRPSIKNQQRWTFGSLYPRAWADHAAGERSEIQTQVLLIGHAGARVTVRVRFLHVVDRAVGQVTPAVKRWVEGQSGVQMTDALTVGGQTFRPWQEAIKREFTTPALVIDELLENEATVEFAFAGGREVEPVCDEGGLVAGVLIRTRYAVRGRVTARAERVEGKLHRLTVAVHNETPVDEAEALGRDQTLLRGLASTHMVLSVDGGWFVSLIDPPEDYQTYADACEQHGCWPVLVGDPGQTDTMLAAPIILYDYPQISPESPGNLFDGTEIDEILSLRVQALTDEEKKQVLATDSEARQLLMRTDNLSVDQQQRLHGTMRRLEDGRAVQTPILGGRTIRAGDRVRLDPKRSADAFDTVLRGMTATITSIEHDLEDRVHVAVTLDDDPGADFGAEHLPGHRFFFSLEEVHLLAESEGAS